MSRRRGDIQGLRAVAVLLVALNHAGVGFLGGGYIGVDVFFVISGFLITSLLLRGRAERGYVRIGDFYSRRARRILPAATLTLIVTDIAAYHLVNFVRARQDLHDSVSAATFTANIHFIHVGTNYFALTQPPSPFQHYWSLSVEEQFYIVWPLLLAILLGAALRRRYASQGGASDPARRRLFVGVLAIGLASLAWSIAETDISPVTAYFSTLSRAWELALGAGLALAAPALKTRLTGASVWVGWVGLAAIAVSAVEFSPTTAFPGYVALIPTLGAAFVLASGLSPPRQRLAAGRLLDTAPLRYVGDRSYAFYLWHWPVLTLVAEHEGHDLSVLDNLALLGVAFVLSVVSYQFVEDPMRRPSWRFPLASPVFWSVPLAVVGILGIEGLGTQLSTAAKLVVALLAFLASLGTRAGLRSYRSRRPEGMGIPRLQLGPTATGLALWPVLLVLAVAVAGHYLDRINATAAELMAGAEPANPRSLGRLDGSAATGRSQALSAVRRAVRAADHGKAIPATLSPPVSALLDDHYSYPDGCAPADDESASRICHLGTSGNGPLLAVVGDSKSQMWMPDVLSVARRDGWTVAPLSKSSCTPFDWATEDQDSSCQAWYRWAVRRIRQLHPAVTLVAGNYDEHTDTAEGNVTIASAIGGLVRRVENSSRRVIVIGDIPGQDEEPVDCLLTSGATLRTCTTRLTPYQLNAGARVKQVARESGAGFIQTQGWFCFRSQCPMVVGHTIVAADSGHVSKTYSAELSTAFRSAFRRQIHVTDAPSRCGVRCVK